jgi:predicted RNase H-like HicB family nuclease
MRSGEPSHFLRPLTHPSRHQAPVTQVERLVSGSWASYAALEVSMKYKIAIHKSEEGYSVSVPGLPGCWSQGATELEALENIREAIRDYLAVVDEQLKGEEVREVEITV